MRLKGRYRPDMEALLCGTEMKVKVTDINENKVDDGMTELTTKETDKIIHVEALFPDPERDRLRRERMMRQMEDTAIQEFLFEWIPECLPVMFWTYSMIALWNDTFHMVLGITTAVAGLVMAILKRRRGK